MTRLKELETRIAELGAEASLEYERERQRERERQEAETRLEKERLAAEAEARDRKKEADLQDVLRGMRAACLREEQSRAGTLPLPPAEPLTCYQLAGGKFGEWGLCAVFLRTISAGQRPDICSQCQHGFQNERWLKGFYHRELAQVPG